MAAALGLTLRTGVHTGECEADGEGDLHGLAVHVCARIMAMAEPGNILVSSTVKDVLGSTSVEFWPIGEHELRGVPGNWAIFRVEAPH